MSSYAKAQANIDSTVKLKAERIIKEIGLNPTTVINGLYREIIATGRIPLSFALTEEQRADLSVLEASKSVPVKHLRTKEEIEGFFNGED